MKDTYRHKGLRRQLINHLAASGIKDIRVLQAMARVPRHFFLDQAFEEWAYRDAAFPIGFEQTISQPYTVAFQSQLLQIKKNDRVLEIGTGSGYQAVILQEMGARVYTIERQEGLYHKTAALFKKLNYKRIRHYLGDGFKGLPKFGPYHKIILTAAPDKIPSLLLDQLAVNGRMVLPLGSSTDAQKMLLITKDASGKLYKQTFDEFRFVPMLSGVNHHKAL